MSAWFENVLSDARHIRAQGQPTAQRSQLSAETSRQPRGEAAAAVTGGHSSQETRLSEEIQEIRRKSTMSSPSDEKAELTFRILASKQLEKT
ncbi:hypothetical protein AOLI_G00099280 [Acnodon oligacanthus]